MQQNKNIEHSSDQLSLVVYSNVSMKEKPFIKSMCTVIIYLYLLFIQLTENPHPNLKRLRKMFKLRCDIGSSK